MAIIDYDKEQQKLEAAIVKAVKNCKGIYCSKPSFGKDSGVYFVQVETMEPETVASVINNVILKSKYGIIMQSNTFVGSFDWKSDTYIKDCTVIEYTLK